MGLSPLTSIVLKDTPFAAVLPEAVAGTAFFVWCGTCRLESRCAADTQSEMVPGDMYFKARSARTKHFGVLMR